MQPENTTPEPIVNGTPSLAAQLQAPAKRKHTGVTLIVLSVIAFGIAAYAYFFMGSSTSLPEQAIIDQKGDVPQQDDSVVSKEEARQAILDKIEKEDGQVQRLSEEEREAALARIEKEDGVPKLMTDAEREQMLQVIEYQDANAANQQQ